MNPSQAHRLASKPHKGAQLSHSEPTAAECPECTAFAVPERAGLLRRCGNRFYTNGPLACALCEVYHPNLNAYRERHLAFRTAQAG